MCFETFPQAGFSGQADYDACRSPVITPFAEIHVDGCGKDCGIAFVSDGKWNKRGLARLAEFDMGAEPGGGEKNRQPPAAERRQKKNESPDDGHQRKPTAR